MGPHGGDTQQLTAALSGRYVIQRELGRGGMATVYLAEDIRHQRNVALKVLKPELAQAVGAERFLREIVIAAGLHHPHILPLYDSGEADGLLYYVMPYVEGESLRDRLTRERQLPLDDALRIAREVADALSHAHSRGVVHRDIKPDNILLGGGHALVADFGIARAIDVAGAGRLTETGLAVGTPLYMSPEQAAGEKELDGRTDIYSLACVLYEMLAGEPPFTGATAQVIWAKRLSEPVPRVSVVREIVPPGTEAALLKALARTPADRFATAAQFAEALSQADSPGAPDRSRAVRRRAVAVGAAALAIAAVAGLMSLVRQGERVALDPNVIAVAPFRVTAPDDAYDYLRDGGVDLLNAHLNGDGVPRAVDSRTMISRWQRAVASAGGEPSIAEALELARGVGAGRLFLVELLVTPARITVSGRLLAVPGGAVLAEHTAAGRRGEVDEITLTERVLGRVVAVAGGEAASRVGSMSDSITAVKAYLAGRQAHRRGDYQNAFAQYARALAVDPNFALAAMHRLTAANWLLSWGHELPVSRATYVRDVWVLRDRLSTADQAILRAMAGIGPNYPEPYTMAERIAAAQHAARLNPHNAHAFFMLGNPLVLWGRLAGAEDWLSRGVTALDSAIALDPSLTDATWTRLHAALVYGDSADIRRAASRYFASSEGDELRAALRWVVARALSDSVAMSHARVGLGLLTSGAAYGLVGASVWGGLPLGEVDEILSASLSGHGLIPGESCTQQGLRVLIAAIRGRPTQAVALADSAPACYLDMHLAGLALVEPGYEAVAGRVAQRFLIPPEASSFSGLCYAELLRVARGDTIRTRAAAERIDVLVREPEVRVLHGHGLCARVLEAALEAGHTSTPALSWFHQLHSGGIAGPPSEAGLLLARWLEARGDTVGALAAVRRRDGGYGGGALRVLPATLREEGRLAALSGDTAAAVLAYEHYLRLRDAPEPGPMSEEVRRVQAHLATLVREGDGTGGVSRRSGRPM